MPRERNDRGAGGKPLATGTLVGGRYEVVGILGEGGMGTLYTVRTQEGEQFALRLTVAKDPKMVLALKETIALHARLRHLRLCPVRDCGEHAGRVWYAMDLLEGSSVDQLVYRSGPLDPSVASQLIRDAAATVALIHEAGFVHQDLKQGSLFESHGAVTLLEFGVLSALTVGTGTPLAKLSTPSTRAPGMGAAPSTDPRMDVYALGAVLYYMVVGRRAFPEGRQYLAIAERIGVAPPPLDKVPAQLRPILERALALRPDDRFQTARDLEAELAKLRAVA